MGEENDQQQGAPGIDLQNVPEHSYSPELIIRIGDVRAQRLSPEGRATLINRANDLVSRMLSEGMRIAVVNQPDAFGPISRQHIEQGFQIVIESCATRTRKRASLRRLSEAFAAAFLGATFPLAVERHFWTCFVCFGLTVAIVTYLYITDDDGGVT